MCIGDAMWSVAFLAKRDATSATGLLTDGWERLRVSAAAALLHLPAPLPGLDTHQSVSACSLAACSCGHLRQSTLEICMSLLSRLQQLDLPLGCTFLHDTVAQELRVCRQARAMTGRQGLGFGSVRAHSSTPEQASTLSTPTWRPHEKHGLFTRHRCSSWPAPLLHCWRTPGPATRTAAPGPWRCCCRSMPWGWAGHCSWQRQATSSLLRRRSRRQPCRTAGCTRHQQRRRTRTRLQSTLPPWHSCSSCVPCYRCCAAHDPNDCTIEPTCTIAAPVLSSPTVHRRACPR